MNLNRKSKGNRRGLVTRPWLWLSGLVGVAAVAATVVWGVPDGSGGDAAFNQPLSTVKRGPLTINVTTTGDLSSQEATIIRNPVEEDTTVLTLVDQGTQVKKGDVLAQLDDTTFKDERDQLLLDVESAQAEKVTAEQNLETTRQQGQANILDARVQYELAKLDFRKYLGAEPPDRLTASTGDDAIKLEGEQQLNGLDEQVLPDSTANKAESTGQPDAYQQVMGRIRELNNIPLGQTPEYSQLVNELTSDGSGQGVGSLLEAENANFDRQIQQILNRMEGQYKQNIQSELNTIRISEAELKRAVDRLSGSIRLEEKGYITETELEADQLEVKRLLSELQQSRGSLRLTRRYTFQRELANLRNQLEQREFALSKAKAEAQSNLVQAKANLRSKKSRLEQLQTRLAEAKRRIEACTVRAPKDGVVVYVKPDHEWDEIISEGAEVDDRQKMFRLPSSDQMVATVNLHQSVVGKVKPGMKAQITTSGSDGTFIGEVRKVNRLPDTDSSRRAANEKIYKCEIVVDSNGQLRPGMSVKADILVDQFDEATYVPLQAVVRRDGKPHVFVPSDYGPQPVPVEIGGANNKWMRIVSGIEPGQSVMLTPPLGDSEDSSQPRLARGEEGAGESSSGGEDEASRSDRPGRGDGARRGGQAGRSGPSGGGGAGGNRGGAGAG